MRLVVSLLSLTMSCEAYLAFPPSVYVCRSYPFCQMDLKTRTWSSSLTDGQGATTGMFEALEMPDSIRKSASQQGNFSREGTGDDSDCWINEAYCAPDYSVPPLTGTDVDSAAKCRAACKKDKDCNFFTFHNYHGQAKCYKLSTCSLTVANHCPSSGICTSGSAECGCPALEANPTDSTSTTAYATWSCDSGVDPYSQTIPAGTNCKTDCKGWTGQVSVSLASTCQPMGDWSDTQTSYGKHSARNGRSFNLNKPDSGPIKCACRDLGPYNYNPNTRSGETGIIRFQCDGWSPEKYTAPFTINTNDRCDLFCDKALVKTIQCEANTWSGEPEKGFWCMSPPEQVALAVLEEDQKGNEKKDVDCVVSSWSTWGGCSSRCGGGTRDRTRTVTKQRQGQGATCPALSDSQACNTGCCPVGCSVSSWSPWRTCSKSCGSGTKSRSRGVTIPASCGGAACPGLSDSQPCNTAACPGLPTVYSQPSGELELKRDTLLTTLPSLGLQWEVAFRFKPTNYDYNGWSSILHMTIGSDNGRLGDRIPAFFYKPRVGLQVATAIGSDKNSYFNIKPAPPSGQWSSVVVSQLKTGSTTTFSVKINDAAPLTRENPAPRAFSFVKVFASDPWFKGQPGSIRGLTIKTQ